MIWPDLPIVEHLDEIGESVLVAGSAVVVAPPGAGKSTLVPLFLAERLGWSPERRVVMVEPRRVAARATARRMAQLLGEEAGGRVGYITRVDRAVGRNTSVLVMTEGVLLRQMLQDPSLAGVSVVIFDEFHERSLEVDTALAWWRAMAGTDERPAGPSALVMSATIDPDAVAEFIGRSAAAPIISADGRSFPVEVRWSPRRNKERVEAAVVRAVRTALRRPGDVLVFVSGIGAIHRVERELTDVRDPLSGGGLDVRPLYGAQSAADQDLALYGRSDERRVIVSTNLAETSLTVEGISVVVDAGVVKRAVYDAASAMDRLIERPISRAEADQRSGRAGRLGPGVAIRCWSKVEHAARARERPPEIRTSDLSGWWLSQLAMAEALGHPIEKYIEEPPERARRDAVAVLTQLEAIAEDGLLTDLGRRIEALPVHPRLGRMIVSAEGGRDAYLACVVAAICEAADFGPRDSVDLRRRVALVVGDASGGDGVNERLVRTVRQQADDLARRLGIAVGGPIDIEQCGPLAATAYPERVATARGSLGRFQLEGTSAFIPKGDPLGAVPIIAVCAADVRKSERRIRLAAPLI